MPKYLYTYHGGGMPETEEEQAVHMKILSTTDNSYTFEYNIVGDNNKSRGTAIKIN